MVFDGEAVGFVLDPGNQAEAFRVAVDGKLYITILETAGAVVVVFDHTADRDIEAQLVQYL